jgi:hypothetical protein
MDVGGEQPTDGAAARARQLQPALLQCRVQRFAAHAGLDRASQVVTLQTQDAVHRLEADHAHLCCRCRNQQLLAAAPGEPDSTAGDEGIAQFGVAPALQGPGRLKVEPHVSAPPSS